MLPPLLLLLQAGKPIQPGEKILDLCAAPGGKTTLLASLSHGKNPITAIEQDSMRFQILLSNIKRQGCENIIQAKNADGTELWREFESAFDRILVDAPCSAEAGFKARNARTFAYWSLRRVKECAYIQKRLLASAWRCLKYGGYLAYSTCTFAPEENEEVIQWLLEKFPGEVSLLPLQIPLKNVRNGILSWNGKSLFPSLIQTKRILPTDCMEGFYIALLRKIVP
jgi:16S rRNA (cytosine1407-C5)-methyltransferase